MTEIIRLRGRVSDLADGLTVRRVLPAAARRSVGPFVFFDHFRPVSLKPETDSDVGAHPHIGLATVSYLFEGSLLHRDSLGTVQTITPGAINWMTAGRGIVHSEYTPHGCCLRWPPRWPFTARNTAFISMVRRWHHNGAQGVRLMVIGGAPLEQPVRMWWNFVATDRERIANAAKRWEEGGFASIPGETDRVQGPKWVG